MSNQHKTVIRSEHRVVRPLGPADLDRVAQTRQLMEQLQAGEFRGLPEARAAVRADCQSREGGGGTWRFYRPMRRCGLSAMVYDSG